MSAYFLKKEPSRRTGKKLPGAVRLTRRQAHADVRQPRQPVASPRWNAASLVTDADLDVVPGPVIVTPRPTRADVVAVFVIVETEPLLTVTHRNCLGVLRDVRQIARLSKKVAGRVDGPRVDDTIGHIRTSASSQRQRQRQQVSHQPIIPHAAARRCFAC